MRLTLAPALAALALLAACEHDIYTVRMQATESGFDRHVEVLHERYNGEKVLPPTELLERVGVLYGHTGPITKGAFDAEFEDVTPADIGGHGRLARSTTSLGATLVYLERFRGEDDLSARLERVQTAASAGADLVLGWLDSALAPEPAWPRFRESLAGGRLDRDFRNLALLVWLDRNSARTHAPPSDADGEEPTLIRAVAYLHEHGYISTDELPALASLSFDDNALSRAVTSWLAGGMGLDDDDPPATLAPFATSESLNASWEAYLVSPDAIDRVKRWAAQAQIPLPDADEAAAGNEADELFVALLSVATGSEPSEDGAEDEVHLALACPVEPLTTNGTWAGEERQITWWFNVEPDPEAPYLVPAIAYAAWTEPDDAFQTEHLGAVLLTGEALARYTAWRSTLGPAEGERWDRMLASLSGHDSARAAVEQYKPGDDPAWSAEPNGRTILIEALLK